MLSDHSMIFFVSLLFPISIFRIFWLPSIQSGANPWSLSHSSLRLICIYQMNKFTECSATKIYKEIVSTRQNNLILKYTIYRQNSQLVQNTSGRDLLWGPARGVKNITQRTENEKINLKMATIGPK